MAVTGYFLDKDWNYCKILLGFESLSGLYTDNNLSKTVIKLFTEYKIVDRILSIITDNTTNNDILIISIQKTLQSQIYSDISIFRVLYIVYIIQFSLNKLFGKFKTIPENKKTELE